eukprot:141150-Prymnesium_polylepis.1
MDRHAPRPPSSTVACTLMMDDVHGRRGPTTRPGVRAFAICGLRAAARSEHRGSSAFEVKSACGRHARTPQTGDG